MVCRQLSRPWNPTVLAAFVACVVGCDAQRSDRSTTPPEPPTAEERFESFLSTLKRKVDDPAIRDATAVSSYGSAPGTPLTEWTTTVTHEYADGDGQNPPRAVVTLTTRSTVTVVLPTADPDDEPKKPGRDSDPGKPELVAELEALVAPPAGVSDLGKSSIQTLPAEEVTRLELEYRGDEWVLLTELDEANQPFTSSAIRYALKRQ